MKKINLNSPHAVKGENKKESAPVISYERVRKVEEASLNKEFGFHPLQELPVPAELWIGLIELAQQVVNDETQHVIQTQQQLNENGQIIGERQIPVTNQTQRGYLATQLLRKASILGIAYHEKGLVAKHTDLQPVYQKMQTTGLGPSDFVPIPGAPEAVTAQYYHAVIEKPASEMPEPQTDGVDCCKHEGCECSEK